jgi:hypothetical protein
MIFMIATVLAVVLLFVHAWADERAAIEESFESYPWQQVYAANKDALSALRYGNMKNGSYVAVAENYEWISSIGNATHKEREALTSIFGFNEYGLEYNTIIMEDSCIYAVIRLDNKTCAVFDCTGTEPSYPSPGIIQKVDNGVFLSVIPEDYLALRQNSGIHFGISLTDSSDIIVFFVLVFVFIAADTALLIHEFRQSQV